MSKFFTALLLAMALPLFAYAQGTAPAPAPVETAPLAVPVTPAPVPAAPSVPAIGTPAPATPAPAQQAAPPAASPPAAAQAPAVDPNSTLAGKPGDPVDVDEMILAPKVVLVIAGQTSWDKGFETLKSQFARLKAAADKEGLKVAGRPLTLFVETDDNGYRYEAMLPVDRTPETAATLGNGIRMGLTPSGKTMRFTHKAPYEDVDSTYETITAYLEAKGVVVKDAFMEEYITDMVDITDPNLEMNVYVQPK